MKALQAGLAVTLVTAVVGAVGLTTASTGCTGTGQVRQIFMSLDGEGNRVRDIFYTDTTTIDCDVVFSAVGTDNTVDAQIIQTTGESKLYDGNNDLGAVSYLWSTAETVPNAGLSTLSFSFTPPTALDGGTPVPWAVGHYKCVIQVNGATAGDSEFDIDYPTPDCPAAGGAYDGLSCIGNKGNDHCPSDSAYDPNNPTCRCQAYPTDTQDPLSRTWVECQQ